ncbi:MAG: TolC family protein [Eubacteriales bacterium]|nr:TolC family protein [Eubacteriales bacterium]
MIRGKLKKFICITLVMCLSIGIGVVSFADGPAEAMRDLDEATYARIMDNRVEWDEIENLVKYYNPSYRMAADMIDNNLVTFSQGVDKDTEKLEQTKETIEDAIAQIDENIRAFKELPATQVVDQYGTTAAQMIRMLNNQKTALKSNRSQVNSGISQYNGAYTKIKYQMTKQLSPIRKQLIQVIEGLFFTYNGLMLNRELVVKQIGIYEKVCSTQRTLKEQGLATDIDIASADANLVKARNTLKTIDNGIYQVKVNIGLQTGYSAENVPEIGGVPAPDTNYVLSINPEEDRNRFVSEDGNVKSAEEYKDAATKRIEGKINSARMQAVNKYDLMYAGLLDKKAEYEVSSISAERARLTKEQARRQYELGMISLTEYAAKELECLSYESGVKSAALSYAQAINEYKWTMDNL